jgi:hypothetical protein
MRVCAIITGIGFMLASAHVEALPQHVGKPRAKTTLGSQAFKAATRAATALALVSLVGCASVPSNWPSLPVHVPS